MKTQKNRRRRGKPPASRGQPKRRFVLFCEGKNTEPGYFSAIRRMYDNTLLEIYPGVGVPHTVAEKAVAYLKHGGSRRHRRNGRSAFEAKDQVWAVFDRDQHPNFDAAIRLCEHNGVQIGLSNPCFELWLVLHSEDYNRPETTDNIQTVLSKIHPEYNRRHVKKLDFDSLILHVVKAEDRANRQLLLRKDVDDPYGNPSTRVGKLTSEIRQAHDGHRM